MIKTNDIRDLTDEEIEKRIGEEERDLTDIRFRKAVTGLDNPTVLREKRRDIARLKTVLSERKLGISPS